MNKLSSHNFAQTSSDLYQKRYLAHQKRKKDTLIEIMKQRHSERMFSEEDIPKELIYEMMHLLKTSPSSCDRHGVGVKVVEIRDEKELLGGILVGGVGWLHRAKYIILFFGDPVAYKADNENEYMPYLDAGVMIQQLALLVAANNLSGCYVNPNIRNQNIKHFHEIFGEGIFCGAYAIGKPIIKKETI